MNKFSLVLTVRCLIYLAMLTRWCCGSYCPSLPGTLIVWLQYCCKYTFIHPISIVTFGVAQFDKIENEMREERLYNFYAHKIFMKSRRTRINVKIWKSNSTATVGRPRKKNPYVRASTFCNLIAKFVVHTVTFVKIIASGSSKFNRIVEEKGDKYNLLRKTSIRAERYKLNY